MASLQQALDTFNVLGNRLKDIFKCQICSEVKNDTQICMSCYHMVCVDCQSGSLCPNCSRSPLVHLDNHPLMFKIHNLIKDIKAISKEDVLSAKVKTKEQPDTKKQANKILKRNLQVNQKSVVPPTLISKEVLVQGNKKRQRSISKEDTPEKKEVEIEASNAAEVDTLSAIPKSPKSESMVDQRTYYRFQKVVPAVGQREENTTLESPLRKGKGLGEQQKSKTRLVFEEFAVKSKNNTEVTESKEVLPNFILIKPAGVSDIKKISRTSMRRTSPASEIELDLETIKRAEVIPGTPDSPKRRSLRQRLKTKTESGFDIKTVHIDTPMPGKVLRTPNTMKGIQMLRSTSRSLKNVTSTQVETKNGEVKPDEDTKIGEVLSEVIPETPKAEIKKFRKILILKASKQLEAQLDSVAGTKVEVVTTTDGSENVHKSKHNQNLSTQETEACKLLYTPRKTTVTVQQNPTSAGSIRTLNSPARFVIIPKPKTPSTVKKGKRNFKGETLLHLACKRSLFKEIRQLLNEGADVNAQDNAGWTPLHDAAMSGNTEVVKVLLSWGAKTNVPGIDNSTALHKAVAQGHEVISKLLVEHGADINARNIFGQTPLEFSSFRKEIEKVLLTTEVKVKPAAPVTDCHAVSPIAENVVVAHCEITRSQAKMLLLFCDRFNAKCNTRLSVHPKPTHLLLEETQLHTIPWEVFQKIFIGIWVVSFQWVEDSLECGHVVPAARYELPGPHECFRKARLNRYNQKPGLFSGCQIFFGGNIKLYTKHNLTCDSIKNLVSQLGGKVLTRWPNPETVERTVPYHAAPGSSLASCSAYFIYQPGQWEPRLVYNMTHIKALPLDWLLSCLLTYSLVEPDQVVECQFFQGGGST